MEAERHDCPMCGAVMGTEAQPAAIKKGAEMLDCIDTLERRLREAEQGTWRLTANDAVCLPCREGLVGIDFSRSDATTALLHARLTALRNAHAQDLRRSA